MKFLSDPQIGKILGLNISSSNYSDESRIQILKDNEKYDDFLSIVEFIEKSGRTEISSFIHKCKDLMTQYIKNENLLEKIPDPEEKIQRLKEELDCQKIKLPKKDQPINGRCQVLVDIQSANFTALKALSNGKIPTDMKWEDYFKKIIPFDQRTNRPGNLEKGVEGTITTIPECVYQSKYFRMMVLSKVQPQLQLWWEEEILKIAKQFKDLDYVNNVPIQLGSDEFILDVVDYDEGHEICSQLIENLPPYVRTQTYCLYRVHEYLNKINSALADNYKNPNYLIYIYKNFDGEYTYSLKNIPAFHLKELYSLFDEYFIENFL